jgi:uncharacterized protein YijF (DUF1287 family)
MRRHSDRLQKSASRVREDAPPFGFWIAQSKIQNLKSKIKTFRYPALLVGVLLLAGCRKETAPGGGVAATPAVQTEAAADPLALNPEPRTVAEKIVNGAKEEARRGVVYDAGYIPVAYPGGDVPKDRGACVEVVIRALRRAGYDLQARMHQDMERRFALYPKAYGMRRPDASIDHRRVRNQMTFLRRFGRELPGSTTGAAKATWQPGDLVYWRLDNNLNHCGVCSDVRNADGLPLVIHNLSMTRQEDCLTAWKILGHFRYPAPAPSRR